MNTQTYIQRIHHLEKLVDDAEKALAFEKSRVDLLTAERDQLIEKNNKLVAENVGLTDFVKVCFRDAANGTSMDAADIQTLGERLGLFVRETYQPALHGYICGHEPGEDTVYVMKKITTTDAAITAIRAEGVEMFANLTIKIGEEEDKPDIVYIGKQALLFATQLRQGGEL